MTEARDVATHVPETVLLVGGSPEPSSSATVRRAAVGCTRVVAIDRGLDALTSAGLTCDLFCGDGDSVGERGAREVERAERRMPDAPFAVVRYNPHKDDTDLGLALGEIERRWPGARVRTTCFAGGNPDHLLGVLGRLAAFRRSDAAGANAPVELVEDGFEGRVLQAGGTWEMDGAQGRRFSFMVLSPHACVSEVGMRWELDHHRVELLDDLGISNVIEADMARISCHEGTVGCWLFS